MSMGLLEGPGMGTRMPGRPLIPTDADLLVI